jgi:hypothetical protein
MGKRRLATLVGAAGLVAVAVAPLQSASAATQVFTGAGNASVATAIADFKAAIGGANNGTGPPPAATGFRQINWDGVPINASNEIVPNKVGDVATDQFQGRGVIFSDDNAVANDGFASTNGSVGPADFPPFSSPLIFAPYNDNTVEVHFVQASTPGTTPIPAATRGFGAVFLDVETPTTTIEYFKGALSLGKYTVGQAGHGQSSFLGVVFDNPVVTSVVITLGTAKIFNFPPVSAGGNDKDGADLVAADDFVYGEPGCTRTIGAVLSPTVVASPGDIVCLNGTTVNGSVQAGPNSVVVMNGGFVTGNVTTNTAAFLSLCGTTVRGAVTAQSTSGFVRIGDAQNDDGIGCLGNNIRGNVSVLNGRGGFEVGGNQIFANMTATDNQLFSRIAEARPGPLQLGPSDEDGHEIEGNYIGGQLTCLRNNPNVTDDGKPNQVVGSSLMCEMEAIG